ncbi:MAG: hypothetical protein AAF502_25620 [Bacteroidota bacterium]
MKSLLSTLCLCLLVSAGLFAQKKSKKQEKQFRQMLETTVDFEKPSEAFTKMVSQDGYQELATEAKIVAMYLPVDYQEVLEDFQDAKENDDRVTGSGEVSYGNTTGYYNQISIPAPADSDKENFTGIIAIVPVKGGTINVSALCPDSLADEYIPLYLKSIGTVAVKK